MATTPGTTQPEPFRSPFLPPIITTTQPAADEPSPHTSSGRRSARGLRVRYSDEVLYGSRDTTSSGDRNDIALPLPPSQPVLGVGYNAEARLRGLPLPANGTMGTSSGSSAALPIATAPAPAANGTTWASSGSSAAPRIATVPAPAANGTATPQAGGGAGGRIKRVGVPTEDCKIVFRGYSWKVCQDIMADVKGHEAAVRPYRPNPDATAETCDASTEKVRGMVRLFVRMEECCLGREHYDATEKHLVWPELQNARNILGVWRALHRLGLKPVQWYRWANLVLVVARAIFNSGSIIYYFTQWQPAQQGWLGQYRSLIAMVVWFELLVTSGWLLYLFYSAWNLARSLKRYRERGQRAQQAVPVALDMVGLVKAMQRLGTISAMRGAKHAISIMRIFRWYKRMYRELRFKGNYVMHHLMTMSPDMLKTVLNSWWSTAASVVNRPGSQELDEYNPFRAQRHKLPKLDKDKELPTHTNHQPHSPTLDPTPAPTNANPLQYISSRFRSMRLPTQVSTESVRQAVLNLPHACASCIAAMPRFLVSSLVKLLLLCVLLAMGTWPLWGLAAFFTKLGQLKFVSQKFIGKWTSREVLLFVAFMNQLAALESSEQYRLEGQLQLLFYGSDAQYSEEEKDAEHCLQTSIVLDSWLHPEGSLIAAAAKLLWLGPDDINAAFIQDWEGNRPQSWLP